jgi:hypothetical protein
MILQPSFSPKPTILSLDLGEISSITCSFRKLSESLRIKVRPGWRTCAAYKNALKFSQSPVISASSSARRSFPFTQSRAAARCSERIRSTVLLNDATDPSAEVPGVSGGELARELQGMRESIKGVAVPDRTGDDAGGARCRASDAARKRRLVVPSCLVEPERAEQTIASLCRSKWSLQVHETF